MAEPVTIGGQTFIKTADGWVDQKSKAKAPEGLLSLLNRLQVENSPEGKKKRVKIDTSRPVVKLGKTEYVWDLNSKVWIDKKTKDAANPAFSKLIEAAYQGIVQGTTEEEKLYESWAKKAAAGQVFTGMGVAGQAAKQKVKKPTGGGQFSVANVKINSPIIRMIEKLSVIDGYLKQRLANDMAIANSQSVSAKEQAIEQSTIQTDATPNLKEDNVDAEVEKTNKESQAILIAGAAAAGALFISQLDPVKETFNSIVNFSKGVYNFVSDIAGVINEGLVKIVGTPESRGEQSSTTPGANPTANTERSAGAVQPANSGAGEGTAFPGPGESSASNGRASNGAATPEEITTPFPGPTSSSNTPSSSAPASPSSSTTPVRSDARRVPSPSTSTPAAATPSAPAATPPPPPPAPAATPVRDDRNWWQRNMPSWLGGEEAPTSSATPSAPTRRDAQPAAAGVAGDITDLTHLTSGSFNFGQLRGRKGFIIHHTAGRGTAEQVINVFKQTNFPAQYIIDRNGKIFRALPSGRRGQHIRPGWGPIGSGLSNSNTEGVEIIANNDSDVLPAQVEAAKRLVRILGYHDDQIYGHGEVNPGHKMPNEGGQVLNAIRGGTISPRPGGGVDHGGGGADTGSGDQQNSSVLGKIVGSGIDLTKGAMESIATILRAGLGGMTLTSGSQLSTVNDTMSGNIARAARERTATVAATKTSEPVATTRSDPVNLNASNGSATIQNMPTNSDRAGVEFYLTRMGFPRIIYTQTARGATLR